MSDIVAKLKDGTRTVRWSDDRVRLEAAAEIERLRVRVAELEAERNEARSVLKEWEYAALKNYPKGRAWTGTPAQILSVFVDVATSAEKSSGRWKAEALAWRAWWNHPDTEVRREHWEMRKKIDAARAANGEVGQ